MDGVLIRTIRRMTRSRRRSDARSKYRFPPQLIESFLAAFSADYLVAEILQHAGNSSSTLASSSTTSTVRLIADHPFERDKRGLFGGSGSLLLPETDAFARILGCREEFNAVLVFQHSLHRFKNLSAARIHLFALVRLDNADRLPGHARLQS